MIPGQTRRVDRASIAMVVSNAYAPDPRVAKEALTLTHAGHRVTVYAWDRSGARPERETVDGISIRRLRVPCQDGLGLRQLPNFVRFWSAAARALSGERFQVLHAHDLDGLIPVLLAQRHGARVVYDAHELFPLMVGERAGRLAERAAWALERRLMRRTDLVITDGHPRALAYRIMGAARPVVVENTVDSSAFRSDPAAREKLRASLAIPDRAWVIGIFTGLTDATRFETLWESVAGFRDVWVIVAGRGRESRRIQDLAQAQDRIRYIGYVAELGPWYSAVDAVYYRLTPNSRNSLLGFPNNVATAAVAGVPIVTEDLGYAGVLVRRYGLGPLLSGTDPHAITTALQELRDPDRYATFRSRSRDARERFTWRASAERLVAAYDDLLSAPISQRSR